MENRECPHDKVNELRTGKGNVAPKGRSLPSTDWDQSPQGDGETPKQFRHRGARDSILTTCIFNYDNRSDFLLT